MKAIKRLIKIEDPNLVVLKNLPFSIGDEVEIVILGKEKTEVDVHKLKSLFRETQAIPQLKSISDEEIESEIMGFRSGQ